jgi:hypothetical protein
MFFKNRTPIKRQCLEIFYRRFFRKSITPRLPINSLKYFRCMFRIRWEMYENVFVQRYAAQR